jgi:hypothetical protein
MGQSLKLEPMDIVSESVELANIFYGKDPFTMIILSKPPEPAVTMVGEGFELNGGDVL